MKFFKKRDLLSRYEAKRNFSRTAEPEPRRPKSSPPKKLPMFVIQKHAARRLHYDFRLEMEGVLKSWAVPKGIPLHRAEKHLAMHVEDHPIDYGNFEGIISEGNYGAGTVMVWDTGTYQVFGDNPLKALEDGKIHFTLHGKKLEGEWTLVKMRRAAERGKEPWLLLKSGTDAPPISARRDDESALSKRSMKRIASDLDAEWVSNRSAKLQLRADSNRSTRKAGALRSEKLPAGKIEFIEPMKSRLVAELPEGKDWIYEIKFDGIRAIALKDGKEISLFSRARNNVTAKFPEVANAISSLPCQRAVIDGEIVALEKSGRSSFQLLQMAQMRGQPRPPIRFYVFDLLNLEGKDLKNLPMVQRKEILQSLVGTHENTIRLSANLEADPKTLLAEIRRRGLEGIIAKQRESKYESGRRSGAWLKFKCISAQEFVIGGYTQPGGTRQFFGSILVGYYDGGKLIFASKVGSGFDTRLLESLFKNFQKLKRAECPFANLPEKRSNRFSGGVTAAEMKRCTWVEPKLVCQAAFSEWTRDKHLRQPVFLGLREDKRPQEVVCEDLS